MIEYTGRRIVLEGKLCGVERAPGTGKVIHMEDSANRSLSIYGVRTSDTIGLRIGARYRVTVEEVE